MTTYTIAQALGTNASGIVVLDTASNIVGALPNASLTSRVSVFDMSAATNVAAWQAAVLAGLGSQFTTNGFKLTIRDSVAQLTLAANVAGPNIAGAVVAVSDTAANILAGIGNAIIRNAASIAVTANATLTLANLLILESFATFTAAGVTLTLADSAANLLALTTPEQKPALTVFQVSISSTVTSAQAITLGGMSHFSVVSGVTLTIADTIASFSANAAALTSFVALSGVVEVVADTVTNLLGQTAAVTSLEMQMPHLTVSLSGSGTASVSQLAQLAALTGFHAGTGNVLTISDTVQNLLTLTTTQKALIQATTLLSSGTASAGQLAQLAALPSFTRGTGHTLAVTDSLANLAALTVTQNALASSIAVDDTLAAVVAAQAAHSTVLATAAAVTAELDGSLISVAQLTSLQTLPGITLHANVTSSTLTVADTVANLLTLTTPQKALIQATTLSGNATASVAQLVQLAALPAFSHGSGHTLAVVDTLANLAGLTVPQHALASSSTVDDTVGNILAAMTAHSATLSAANAVTAELDGTNVSVAQLGSLMALPGFAFHANGTSSVLTVADTVQDLLTLTSVQKAAIQATTLAGNDGANLAQLALLVALPSFSHGSGHTLVATDTIANIAALTTPEHAAITSTAIDDTVANILAALTAHSTALSGAGAVTAELDSTMLTTAQAVSLASIAGLHLHANSNASSLVVSDTMQNLANAAGTLATLESEGPVTVDPTNDHTILSAGSAASLVAGGLNPANFTLAVSDTGPAISAVASQIFNEGFEAITVTSGIFAGNAAQLLDPTLHFQSGAIAQLAGSLTTTAANVVALSLLPDFNLGVGATLPVRDDMANLIADAGVLQQFATSVTVADTETVSAQGATTLAQIQTAVGASHFSMGGQFLVVNDTAQALLTELTAPAIALSVGIALTSDARISEANALQFVAMGTKFSPNGFLLTISDTADNLVALANVPATLQVVNGWDGAATLSADGTVTVANATLLSQIHGFAPVAHLLTVSDTASNLGNLQTELIGAAPGSTLAFLRSVIATSLSQNAVNITAATLQQLEALPGFGLGGHSLTVQDTAPALLADFQGSLVPFASGVTLASNTGAWVVGASDATRLADMPGFSAGSAGMQVQDSAIDILATVNAAGAAAASSVLLNAAAVVSVGQAEALEALHGFSRNGESFTISDTETNLATLDSATAALATAIQVQGSPNVTVSEYLTLSAAPGFAASGDSLSIFDTAQNLLGLVGQTLLHVTSIGVQPSATVTADQAQSLSTLANLQTGNNLNIYDSIANLVQTTGGATSPIDAAGEQLASQVTMNGDGTVTVAQGAMLASLGPRFSNGGNHLTLEDTPTNLLSASTSLGSIMSQVTATVLSSNGITPWTATLAQAQQLANLPNFSAGVSGAVIQDNVANILYPGNATIVSEVPAITLNADATGNGSVNVTQAEALHALTNFSLGGFQLNVLDGIGHLATLDSGTANMATSIQLQSSGLATVQQFNAIRGLPNFSTNGKLLVIYDSAANLLGETGSLTLASDIMLNGPATNLSAATAQLLASLPNFTAGIQTMAIVDSAADLVAGTGSRPNDFAGETAASSVTLNAVGGAITAAQADDLALLGGKFSNGGNALTVQDTIANLVSSANASGMALATAVTLKQTETGVPVATWAQVTGLPSFSKGGFGVTVSDTAANLAAASPALLAQANTVQLSAAATLTVAAAETLAGISNFAANVSAPITIADTLQNLLLLGSAGSPIVTAAPIELSANALVTVAQLTALALLPTYHSFIANGFTITVEDSGRHLAVYTPDTIAVPAAYVMIGDATVSAAQGDMLVAENVSLGDNHLTIADTPANLVSLLSLDPGLNALATGLTLNGVSMATVAQATTLAADSRFTTGGDALTVTGSASALLTFNGAHSLVATTLALSESTDTVHVFDLVQLAELGSKFSLNGNTMTVADTATALASLNSLETALVNASVLNLSATVNATTATELAALPHFSLGSSVTLTVQGTSADLTSLPASIQAIATLELTTSGSNLTAAQAAALAALHVSPGTGVIVQDTIDALNDSANTGWPSIATGGYIVTDSVSNLLGNGHTTLLTNANSVTLLGDAEVDATDFETLAGMTNFSRGTAALVVQGSAAEIAADATDIARVASSTLVDSAAAVSAAAAEALATLNASHMLSFTGGVTLAVQDLFSTFQTGSYTAGIALARTITVEGSAADLVTATSFGWGTATVSYVLNAGGTIGAAAAVTLHGLGSAYLANGFTLTVSDGAANVANDATAIQALGIHAQVSDFAANVDTEATALAALGTTLLSVTLTDSVAVHASVAAGLVPIAGKLAVSAIAVSDTATAVNANLTALETLGTHATSVTVSDGVANVATFASALSALGSELLISLTDTLPISVHANVAADLLPVLAQLAGTTISVSDTGAAIAGDASSLAELGSVLGTITLSDGTTVTAAVATELQPIDVHLGTGVSLNVVDTAAAIAGAVAGLTSLSHDGKLGSVTADGETAAHIVTYGATLAGLGATATIIDSAENVSTNLDALEPFSHVSGLLQSITLNDSVDIAVSIGQFTTDADVLGLIGGSVKYAITDSSANIAGDLGATGSSHILTLGSAVDTITVSGGTLSLDASTLLATGVDAALSKLTGGTQIAATNVSIADFTGIDLLAVPPNTFAVVDDGSAIAGNLELGTGVSALLTHLAAITSIVPSGTISIDYATVTTQYVDDGAGSVFSKMPGATLEVTGVAAGHVSAMFHLAVAASLVAVTDTAGGIQGDLGGSSPVLVQYLSQLDTITVSSGTITLDATHALATHVDDDAGSVFGKMSGGILDVTGAEVGQLDALYGLYQRPAGVAVSDEATSIAGDLQHGAMSKLETYVGDGFVTGVAVLDGPVSLDNSFIGPAISDALNALPFGSLQVTNVPIDDIVSVAGLHPFASMTVEDSATNIEGGLGAGSALATHHASITGMTVDGGPVVLTDAAALAADANALSTLPASSLDVTGVGVGDIATIAGIAALASMTVSDSAFNLATDLGLGSSNSELDLHAGKIASVTVNDVGPVAVADAATLSAIVTELTGPAFNVSGNAAAVDTNLSELEALGSHLGTVTVDDTAADVAAYASDLAGLGSKLQITLSDGPTVSEFAPVAAELVPVAAKLSGTTINVSDDGAAVAANATALAQLGVLLGTVTLLDGNSTDAATAAGLAPIANNLGMGVKIDVSDTASAIAGAAGLVTLQTDTRLGSVTADGETAAHIVTYGATLAGLGATATIIDSAENVSTNLDALEPFSHGGGLLQSITLNDSVDIAVSIGQFTTDADVLGLIGGSVKYAITDSSANIAGDLGATGSSHILTLGSAVDTITVSGGTLSLDASTLLATGVDAALSKLTGGTQIAATNVSIADFADIDLLGVPPNTFAVVDDGSAIAGNLELGTGVSALLTHLAAITSIVPSGTISIDYATVTTQYVDDGAGSVFSKMPGATLEVTGVAAGHVSAMFHLAVAASLVAVTDTAGGIQGDLGGSSPVLVQYLSQLDTITVSSGTITLDATHALATHVDDDAGSVFGKMSGGILDVTGAEVGQLDALYGLYQRPAGVAVSDEATSIAGDLQHGAMSKLETYVGDGFVTGVAVLDGPVSLDNSFIGPAISDALNALPFGSLQVTNVPIDDIVSVAGLHPFASMTVTTDVATVEANLGAGSPLATYHAAITGMTISDGPLVLDDATAKAADANALSTLPSSSLDVTGVGVGDIATIAGIAALASMTVSDDHVTISNDLQSGSASSELELHASKISTVTVTGGTVSLSDAQAQQVTAALAKFPASSLTITDASVGNVGTYGMLTSLSSMTVSDIAFNVHQDLVGDTSALETYAATHVITAITVTDAVISLTDTQAENVLDALAILGGGNGLDVSDVSVTDVPIIGVLGALTGMTVTGEASAIHDDLVMNTASNLYIYRNSITGMTVNDGPVHITAVEEPDVQLAALVTLPANSLLIDGVPVTQVAGVAVLTGLIDMTVSDTALDVQNDLSIGAHDLETYFHKITGITVSGQVTLAYTDASSDLDALALLGGTGTLVVTGVTAAGVGSIAALGALDHMTVSDSDVDLHGNLAGANSSLEQYASLISGISFLSGGSVSLTGTQAALVMDALAKLPATSLTVTDALAGQVAALGGLSSLSSMTTNDTGGQIADNLTAINADILKITGFTISSGTVEVDYTTAALVMSALAALPGDTLIVDNVPKAHIDDIAGLGSPLTSMTVSDDGGTISTDLALGGSSVIENNISLITAISVSSGSVSLTDAQADAVSGALAVLQAGSTTITGVPVGADIGTFFGLAAVAGMTISDTAGNVQTDLISGGLIEAAVSKITSIDVGGGTVALTDTEAELVLAALAKLPAHSLTVSGVSVTDIPTIGALTALTTMAVNDDGGTIGTNLSSGASSSIYINHTKISGITLSGGAVSLTDGAADTVFAALSLLPADSLTVTSVPLSDVAHIASLGGVLQGIDVSDAATTVQSDLATGSIITGSAASIAIIAPTGGPVTLTDAQADAVIGVLDKLTAGSLLVSGVGMGDITNIAALTSLAHMTVADTGAAIDTDLGLAGSSKILGHIAVITSVTATDPFVDALTAAAIYDALHAKFDEGALVIKDTGANIVSVANGADAGVLAAALAVQLSGNATGMSAADATTLTGALHGTQTSATVNIVDNAADLLNPSYAAGITLATTVGVDDTAANIQALAPELIAMGSKLVSTVISDSGPISASAVSNLLQLPGLSAGTLTIADTGSQIAAAIVLNGVTFLNANTVELNASSVIAASDAAALEELSALIKGSYTISVSDTATHLTGTLLTAVSDTSLVDHVYLKTTGGTVTVTAATAAALTTIPHFSKNPVGGGTNIVIVQDTAAHLDSSYSTLHSNLSLFDHMIVSTSATVLDSVYSDLLNLGAQPLSGSVLLTVRDSATNIATNAPGQLGSSPSITPSAWQLSGSSSVTEAQAAVLGGLTGFSAGAFTLTLSASASGVSVTAANAIGTLGSSFHLGGFTIGVAGAVSALSALTSGALAVVTPQIQDTIGNIVSELTASSPLLAGSMHVTDSTAISVLQATEFFSLVSVDSGQGIAAASITFDSGPEAVTDTLANVQALTQSSASWIANTTLHTDFQLVVADTVANLANSANTTALAAMSGTTLAPTEAPVGAQALETLFTLETTIHFTRGSGVVTLQDTAVNLLNPSYTDAINLATQITLAGPDTTNAAGAETLMATGKLALSSGTVLTISDTSSDLLDGVLGPAITGGSFTTFVHVTLADDEVLDAQTAAAVVALPGYTPGSSSLSIVDGASYLLTAANHTAEMDATSVTLDGDATVSAATAVALVAVPHFALDGNTLSLASNDYADATTLTTLAGLGSGFNLGGNTLTMTQNASVNAVQLAAIGDFASGLHTAGHTVTLMENALDLSPDEYTALQSDNVALAGHAWSATPEAVTVSEGSGNVEIDGTGISGATVTLYSASGTVLTTTSASPGFTISAAESGQGINVAATETVSGTESAPIIALEQTILTGAASADHVNFAASGQVLVAGGEYMNLYTAGSEPGTLNNPVLIYDPSGHTLSYADGHQTILLVTLLGTATHPASLDASEIFVKHYA